eukprot:m51a1_g5349 hypothetical protein (647) ;mRNA; f:459573-462276
MRATAARAWRAARNCPLRLQVVFSIALISLVFIGAIIGGAAVQLHLLTVIEAEYARRDGIRMMHELSNQVLSANTSMQQYSAWDDTVSLFQELKSTGVAGSRQLGPWLDSNFFLLANTLRCWRFDYELMALYGPDASVYSTYYYPNSSATGSPCSSVPSEAPRFFAEASEDLRELLTTNRHVLLVPGHGPFLAVVRPVGFTASATSGELGFILWASRLERVSAILANAVPAVVSVFTNGYPEGLSPIPLCADSGWSAGPRVETVRTSDAESSRRRANSSASPSIALRRGAPYASLAWAMLADGIVLRTEKPAALYSAGFRVALPMAIAVVVATVGLSITYYGIIEVYVLRRIEAFARFLAGQAHRETELMVRRQKEDTRRVMRIDAATASSPEPQATRMETMSVEEENEDSDCRRGRRGRPELLRDEIAKLAGALRANVETLQSTYERAYAALCRQRQENIAVDLALLVPETPATKSTRAAVLGDVFEMPLALQVMLGFCSREASLENLHFLMDCVVLRVLVAESRRDISAGLLVPGAFERMRETYFGERGQGLNVSSRARRAALEGRRGDIGDFAAVEREVLATVQMDVMARFGESRASRLAALLATVERSASQDGSGVAQLPPVLQALLRVGAARTAPGANRRT